ncbi:alpha/beta hydrolase [Chloroflexota bacterium]
MKGVLALAIRIIAIVAGVYILFAGSLFIFQSHYVYHPERVISVDPSDIGLEFESVSFRTEDKVMLSGWYIPSEGATGVVLFCHGNAGNISHRLESIEIFHRLGMNIFIFDYRGYGRSEGKPSEIGTYRDVEAVWRYLVKERQENPNRIVVIGRSLGGAVAAWLAHSHTPAILILESAFTSAPDIAGKLYPFLPVRLLSRFKYNTAEYLDEVDCPVLIVHSREDEIMPFSHGQRLFERARGTKEFLEISGTHNEGFITSGKRYEEGLNAFITEHLEISH